MLRLLLIVVQNLARNPLRTLLTVLGTMFFTLVISVVWSLLAMLDKETTEKSSNLKAIISEKWRAPSQMPFSYAASLSEAAARTPEDYRPRDSMSWTFFGGTLDPEKQSFEDAVFAFCMEPRKLNTMMDELDSLPPDKAAEFQKAVDRLAENRQGIIVGESRLRKLNKQVGDRLSLHGMLNFKDIRLDLEIVGLFPPGRYDQFATINIEYLVAALDAYPQDHAGQAHPMADRSLALVWLKVEDQAAFQRAAAQINGSPFYSNPAVKIETQAAGIGNWLEAYRDILWGIRYLLVPGIIFTLSLLIANAISISVRERQMEFAVMKVLGFRPNQILAIVVTESVLLGGLAGFITTGLTWYIVNFIYGGIKFPIAFFSSFLIPIDALYWGPALGTATALMGTVLPAWRARNTHVSDVFARVA